MYVEVYTTILVRVAMLICVTVDVINSKVQCKHLL